MTLATSRPVPCRAEAATFFIVLGSTEDWTSPTTVTRPGIFHCSGRNSNIMKIKKRNPIEIIHASCPGEQSNVVEIANVCVRGAHPPNRACEGFSEDAAMCSLKLPVAETELAVKSSRSSQLRYVVQVHSPVSTREWTCCQACENMICEVVQSMGAHSIS